MKWANKAHTRYVAMEEAQRGRPAFHHVRPIGRRATGLRYRHITEDPIVAVAASPAGVSAGPALASIASLDASGSIIASASADATAAASVLATGTATVSALASAAPTLVFAPASRPAGALALVPLF